MRLPIWLVLILVVIAIALWYSASGSQRIDASEARRTRFDKIVDVRTDLEWNIGHHPEAIHLPAATLTAETAAQVLQKNDRILVYCNTGQRSRRAAELLASYGYPNVRYIAEPYTALTHP